MPISIIVAVSENNVIGKDNKLLWHLPADLKYFKQLTIGHSIIMGRKTFESIGKPLPQRKSIIVTRNKNFEAEGCAVVNSLEDAIALSQNKEEVFIIGGAEIYKAAMEKADKIYFTRVHHCFEGDAFFPAIDESTWTKIHEQHCLADEKNLYPYSFLTFIKKNSSC